MELALRLAEMPTDMGPQPALALAPSEAETVSVVDDVCCMFEVDVLLTVCVSPGAMV
ncbi:hypothetical protein LILAB_18665 [Corallococcus macrosporus]|uniref:Uncharacterized protein n=1 Tax=Myxococcus fulvus (strain ATCC BAA-855 / HW-1) TaxID=483219 RepID=F8C6P6_MYXFH|nr:hypothetical protein LILAB_18665 [Corallococcus macrosporus]